MLAQKWQLLEKRAHLNRERIPERVVHANGSATFGTLKITADISHFTKAKVLQPGARSECLLCFSTVAGELGAADAKRGVRGFAEVEQADFSPTNVVPGISHSPDKMLQFCILSYADAHRYRLEVNYESLPVNQLRCPVHSYYRDGAMPFDDNGGGSVNHELNSFDDPAEDPHFRELPLAISSDTGRYNHREGNDDYTQSDDLFHLMSPEQRERPIDTITDAMKGAPKEIVRQQLHHFAKADPAYGNGIAHRLDVDTTSKT